MSNVTLKISGRNVIPDSVCNEFEKAVLKQVSGNIVKELSSLRCSEHGQHPKVIIKGKTIDKLKFEVDGCCQKLIDLAISKMQ